MIGRDPIDQHFECLSRLFRKQVLIILLESFESVLVQDLVQTPDYQGSFLISETDPESIVNQPADL